MCPARAQFPVRVRLKRPNDFKQVFDSYQHRLGNRWMTLLVKANGRDFSRLGLAISRKVARSAVSRNRIKRVVRESFRLHQTELGAWDIVILGRKGIDGRSSRELTGALNMLWTEMIATCAGSSFN